MNRGFLIFQLMIAFGGSLAFSEINRTTLQLPSLVIGNQSSVITNFTKITKNKATLSSGTITACQTEESSCSGTASRSFSGVFSSVLSGCSATGDYAGLDGRASVGITLDGFALSRNFKSSANFSLAHGSPSCPLINKEFNFLILRARNYNDFTEKTDYNSATTYTSNGNTYLPGWVGGRFTYQANTSSIIGQNRFSLANISTASQNATFSYSGFNGDSCSTVVSPNPPVTCRSKSSGRLLSIGTGADEPIGAYVNWTFGPTLTMFATSTGNPVVGVAVPSTLNGLASTALSSRKGHVYTGLYTHYRGRADQVQDVVFMSPDSTNGTTFTIKSAKGCNPGEAGCTKIRSCTATQTASGCKEGRLLDDFNQTTTVGTLTCATLNSPRNDFCSGTYTPNGSSTSGTAVCLPAFNVSGQDLLFCTAQVPSTDSNVHLKTVATFVATTTEQTKLDVTLASCDSVVPTHQGQKGELHLNNTTSSGVFTVKATNVSAREISSLGNLAGYPANTTDFTVVDTGNACESLPVCGSTLSAFSSCKRTIRYQPTSNGLTSDYFAFSYHNGQSAGVTSPNVELRASKGLNSLEANYGTGDYFSSTKKTPLSTTASWGTLNSTNTLTGANGITWNSDNNSVATVDTDGMITFLAREGKATVTSSLWSGLKTDTIDAIPFNPGEALILSSHEGTVGGVKMMSDFNSLREGFGASASPSQWPVSPVMTILAP